MLKKSQVKFILYFLVTFLVIFSLLYSLGLVPDVIKGKEGDTLRLLWDKAHTQVETSQDVSAELPVRIVIGKIGVDATVSNPNTTDVITLDEYLGQGAVRYPGSGSLGKGNMLVFGHSTGFVIVNNLAYKTFNDLGKLKVGDEIDLYSGSNKFVYKVTSVVMKPASKAVVDLTSTRNMLTLVTCNVFAAKEDRYIVEADYIP